MSANQENARAQMRKGILEVCVLALLETRGEAYPSDLIEALKEASILVVEGTLYPLLNRLKNDDMLTYRWEESRSGPPRKYYSLTAKGQQHLQSLTEAWREVNTAVNTIINEVKST